MGSRFSHSESQTRKMQSDILSRDSVQWLCRVARFPYIAKKYGHLLDGYDCFDETNTAYEATLEPFLTRNEPEHFSFRRRQFVKYARNENDMNFCRNSQLLNFKINSWWPAARTMSELEKMIVVQSCDSKTFIRVQSCDRF